jgi:hypothetical protein
VADQQRPASSAEFDETDSVELGAETTEDSANTGEVPLDAEQSTRS